MNIFKKEIARMNAPTEAVFDALKDETGKIQDSPLKKQSRKAGTVKSLLNGEVIQTRPPVYGWSCDSCGALGHGPRELLEHSRLTEHRIFTPTKIARVA